MWPHSFMRDSDPAHSYGKVALPALQKSAGRTRLNSCRRVRRLLEERLEGGVSLFGLFFGENSLFTDHDKQLARFLQQSIPAGTAVSRLACIHLSALERRIAMKEACQLLI